jgi:hypothetical protein
MILYKQKLRYCNHDFSSLPDPFVLTFVVFQTQVSPSVSYDATSMNELRKWNQQYGEGGSRTKSPFGFGNITL